MEIDHLVYATQDLAATVDQLADRIGVRATPGGAHPGRGTRNALIALGPRLYLEILGPDPDQPPPQRPRWFGIDDLDSPRLVAWAVRVNDLESTVARAAAQGIRLGEISAGRRSRPDGVELSWRLTDPDVRLADGVAPFLINWGPSPHPASTAVPGPRLLGLRAEHPERAMVEGIFAALEVDLPLTRGAHPCLVATLAGVGSEVELA